MESKYMVWRKSTRDISYEHATIESAKAEAERIARIHAGGEVYILKQIAVVKTSDVHWERLDAEDPDIPF